MELNFGKLIQFISTQKIYIKADCDLWQEDNYRLDKAFSLRVYQKYIEGRPIKNKNINPGFFESLVKMMMYVNDIDEDEFEYLKICFLYVKQNPNILINQLYEHGLITSQKEVLELLMPEKQELTEHYYNRIIDNIWAALIVLDRISTNWQFDFED